jgi:RNA polymerase sigma factor (sigma-70 family)
MAAAHDEEAELMLKVAADEPSAFEALVARVLPRLLGYFRHLGADRALAEDLAQDVFLKLYRGRRTYTQRARFMTYLLHVARNHWIDVYRHRRLGPTVLSTDAPASRQDEEGASLGASLTGPSQDPAQAADQHALRLGLEQALAQLEGSGSLRARPRAWVALRGDRARAGDSRGDGQESGPHRHPPAP